MSNISSDDAVSRRAAAAKVEETARSVMDYDAPAELFPTRGRRAGRQPFQYKRFDRAADAIRYAIEELSPELLVGAFLEVDEERFDGKGIRALYDSADYPYLRAAERKRGSGAETSEKVRSTKKGSAATSKKVSAANTKVQANTARRAAEGSGAAASKMLVAP